jgi:hypothetical protein
MIRRALLSLVLCATAALAVGWGAASASGATLLCEENATPCPNAKTYAAGTEFSSTAFAAITTNVATIECEPSALSSKTTQEAGVPLGAEITTLTFENCETTLGLKCGNAQINGLPAAASISATGAGNGTLTIAGASFKIVCGALINCTFTPSASLGFLGGQAKGGMGPARITASVALNRAGGICPKTATWTATYFLESPMSGTVWVI